MRGCVNFCCGRRTTDNGTTETRGVLRGPREPKNVPIYVWVKNVPKQQSESTLQNISWWDYVPKYILVKICPNIFWWKYVTIFGWACIFYTLSFLLKQSILETIDSVSHYQSPRDEEEKTKNIEKQSLHLNLKLWNWLPLRCWRNLDLIVALTQFRNHFWPEPRGICKI